MSYPHRPADSGRFLCFYPSERKHPPASSRIWKFPKAMRSCCHAIRNLIKDESRSTLRKRNTMKITYYGHSCFAAEINGKHLLLASFSGFDPGCVKTRMFLWLGERANWPCAARLRCGSLPSNRQRPECALPVSCCRPGRAAPFRYLRS